MNDVGNVSEFLYTILYADDTSVLLSGKNYITLIKVLTLELDKLSVWLKANTVIKCSEDILYGFTQS